MSAKKTVKILNSLDECFVNVVSLWTLAYQGVMGLCVFLFWVGKTENQKSQHQHFRKENWYHWYHECFVLILVVFLAEFN